MPGVLLTPAGENRGRKIGRSSVLGCVCDVLCGREAHRRGGDDEREDRGAGKPETAQRPHVPASCSAHRLLDEPPAQRRDDDREQDERDADGHDVDDRTFIEARGTHAEGDGP